MRSPYRISGRLATSRQAHAAHTAYREVRRVNDMRREDSLTNAHPVRHLTNPEVAAVANGSVAQGCRIDKSRESCLFQRNTGENPNRASSNGMAKSSSARRTRILSACTFSARTRPKCMGRRAMGKKWRDEAKKICSASDRLRGHPRSFVYYKINIQNKGVFHPKSQYVDRAKCLSPDT